MEKTKKKPKPTPAHHDASASHLVATPPTGSVAAFVVSDGAPPPAVIVYDPARGKAAFLALWPALEAQPVGALAGRGLDVQRAATAALAVSTFAAASPMRERFALVPAALFDPHVLAALPEVAMAALYTFDEAARAGAHTTRAHVPADVVANGMAIEGRMQRVCEHLLGDDEEEGPVIADLRPGSGPRDLANDLLGYAGIYERNPDVVAADPKYYRDTDLAQARESAGKILAAIASAQTPEARQWSDRLARVWTHLDAMYREVAETGRWLLRADPRAAERFPSLYAVARPGRGRAKVSAKAGGGAGAGEPAADAAGAKPKGKAGG